MLNYLVFPGITDREEEVGSLLALVREAEVDLVQLRNLSIDPVMYWQAMGVSGEGIGMRTMMDRVKNEVPRLQYGYFNRTRENFYPEGFATDWPLPPV